MKYLSITFLTLGLVFPLHATEPGLRLQVDDQTPPGDSIERGLLADPDDSIPTAAPVKDVPFVTTPQEVVDRMLELASVGEEDVVYDLGSGDGRIVITAVRKRDAKRGVGIDIDPARIQESNQNAEQAGVTDRVTFREGNVFTEDFSDASVITMYLLSSVNLKLRPRLLNELEPGTRLVSHAFNMGDWEADKHDVVEVEGRSYDVYFWQVPANASGTWQVTVDGAESKQQQLEIQQNFQNISGRLGDKEIADGRVDGRNIYFKVLSGEADAETRDFTGTLKDDTLSGTMSTKDGEQQWKAERKAGTRQPLEQPAESNRT